MDKTKLTALEIMGRVILESAQQHNAVFVNRAIKQWDIDGQGLFADYIRDYVTGCWRVMIQWN